MALSELFSDQTNTTSFCFNYTSCFYGYRPCDISKTVLHHSSRYNDPSAVWVLIAAIIVFFMKAGFMLVELSFAQSLPDKRHIAVVKYIDAFASAFGFFLIGYDLISSYTTEGMTTQFFQITDPILWFFKFTFASNAATIIGGCLVTNEYKIRLPAAFISAFIISGVIHPIIARLIWTNKATSLSPYRFCNMTDAQGFSCDEKLSLDQRLYVLDFAGGGAVHLLGGVAGLVLCLFAKLQKWNDHHKLQKVMSLNGGGIHVESVDEQDDPESYGGFWGWMYPLHGGGETTSEAALGVLILWFCWFAFNCGSTESMQTSKNSGTSYATIPAIIAVNMILCGASGGVVAVIIAVWAQMRFQTPSVNANEIANGVMSALVAITAGCPFMSYWASCIIGVVAVVLYHTGCYLEYKIGLKDTARVVPVHGICGLWSVLAVGLFMVGDEALCNLHATFEGLCYCELRLPPLNYGELLAAQISGALMIIIITGVICSLMYGLLFLLPMSCPQCCQQYWNKFVKVRGFDCQSHAGNWLFTTSAYQLSQRSGRLNNIDELCSSRHMPAPDRQPLLSNTHRRDGMRARTTLGTLESD